MCILFIAVEQREDYPLIICANRDEFHKRPTKEAHFWDDFPQILAGRDMEAGGSWLGINQSGYFAAITNLRTGKPQSKDKKSRGELVTFFLTEPLSIDESWLTKHAALYNPFNLIFGKLDNLYCFNSENGQSTKLTPGFYAISNGEMGDNWPKMQKGLKNLESLVNSNEALVLESILPVLNDQTRADDTELPSTGIPLEWEQLLSSIFICTEEYGTRSSSILLNKKGATSQFIEVQYNTKGEKVNENNFELIHSN